MRKNGHYNKANNKDNIEISANTNTLKSEMIINNNCDIDFRRYNSINRLLTSLKIWLIFLLSTAY